MASDLPATIAEIERLMAVERVEGWNGHDIERVTQLIPSLLRAAREREEMAAKSARVEAYIKGSEWVSTMGIVDALSGDLDE